MDEDVARRLLEVPVGADATALRAAYRRLLRTTHPDVAPGHGAAERTIELRAAYELLLALVVDDPVAGRPTETPTPPPYRPGARRPARAATDPADRPAPVDVVRLDADTVGIALPPDETLLVVLEAANRLGEVAYLDPSAGLVEVIVEFIDAPTSSVLVHLQGRATGRTEVVCSIEPLSGGQVPPVEAVTTLVQRTLAEVAATVTTE